MPKSRIAISIAEDILHLVDSRMQDLDIHSRSAAIEHFLRKALLDSTDFSAIIMLRANHHKLALSKVNKTLQIRHQLRILERAGVKKIIIITQTSPLLSHVFREVNRSKAEVQILARDVDGTAQAIDACRNLLDSGHFFVLGGDIFFDFNLTEMYHKHIASGRMCTMGLVSNPEPSDLGVAVLSGDTIVRFDEKTKNARSYIINAGIYVFSQKIFSILESGIASLEKQVFPKLASSGKLHGFFIPGSYKHLG